MEKLKFLFTAREEELLMLFCFWHTRRLLKSAFQPLLPVLLMSLPRQESRMFEKSFRSGVKDLSYPKFLLTCLVL